MTPCPGRPSNVSAVSLTGNPDILVPEMVEIEDGLRTKGEEKEKDANRAVRTPRERPEEAEGRSNTREALKTSAQDQISTKGETEEREFRHVPGGTWLNQVRSMFFALRRGVRELKDISPWFFEAVKEILVISRQEVGG
ncbi:hypothetical protein NDU88_006110 [Pleurodeles waltl]|uniref:Uncharacterized protein n=1 Tax=Pleurodeles waltl TaxID=8319 RepID=A0AAV7RQA0_PLEWA|nr:hypothetical protein NDU88_006110 [Pleurodeles waltl]